MTDQQHTELLHALQEAAQMNEGQFVAITERLERIIELLETFTAPPLFAVSGENVDLESIDMKRNLVLAPGAQVERIGQTPRSKSPLRPIKKPRAAKKKGE